MLGTVSSEILSAVEGWLHIVGVTPNKKAQQTSDEPQVAEADRKCEFSVVRMII